MSDHAHSHHVTPTSTFVKTLIWLMLLMVATVAASYIPFPHEPLYSYVSNAILLTIAIIKAVLVIMFFMGVKYSSGLTKMFVVAGFAWFTLLFGMFLDYGTRRYEPVKGWENIRPSSTPRIRGEGEKLEYQRIGSRQQ